jgi:hypothetical protein
LTAIRKVAGEWCFVTVRLVGHPVWMPACAKRLGRYVCVARDRAVGLNAVSAQLMVDAGCDDLRVPRRRLPRPCDRAAISERGGAALPSDRLTTAHVVMVPQGTTPLT